MSGLLDWLFVSQLAIGIILCGVLLGMLLYGGFAQILLGGFLSVWLYQSNLGVHSSPEKVTLAFVKAASELDSAAIMDLVTPETAQLFTPLWGMVSTIGEEEKKRLKDEAVNVQKSTCQYSEDGANAQCTLCCQANGTDIPQAIPTRRISGKWYIHITKENMNNNTEPSEQPQEMPPNRE